MSGKLVQEVLDCAPEELSETERWVLVVLAEDARDKDRVARYATVDVIASRARRAPGTVRNALSSLEGRGLIRGLLQARRGVSQHYQLAKLSSHHRFSSWTDHGSTKRPDKRTRAARRGQLRVIESDPDPGPNSVTPGNDTNACG